MHAIQRRACVVEHVQQPNATQLKKLRRSVPPGEGGDGRGAHLSAATISTATVNVGGSLRSWTLLLVPLLRASSSLTSTVCTPPMRSDMDGFLSKFSRLPPWAVACTQQRFESTRTHLQRRDGEEGGGRSAPISTRVKRLERRR